MSADGLLREASTSFDASSLQFSAPGTRLVQRVLGLASRNSAPNCLSREIPLEELGGTLVHFGPEQANGGSPGARVLLARLTSDRPEAHSLP